MRGGARTGAGEGTVVVPFRRLAPRLAAVDLLRFDCMATMSSNFRHGKESHKPQAQLFSP